MSDSWMSKNVRPLVLVWCIIIFSMAGILDSVETIPFHINETWNDTFEKVMMAVVLAYFGGRTFLLIQESDMESASHLEVIASSSLFC